MLDSTLRPVKDRLLAPVVIGPVVRVPPAAWSALALAAAMGSAAAAWRGAVALSVAAWLASRVLDGVDGLVARRAGRQSDLGGHLDFLGDSIGYAVVPLGLAAGVDERGTWIATAVVLGAFYVNSVSLGHVAAILEKRALGAAHRGEPMSTTLPRGLVEGTETIVIFTLALLLPQHAGLIWTATAIAVAATIAERTIWAARSLTAAGRPTGDER